MASIIVSSGQTSSGIILNKDSMYVSSGGTANSTTVNFGGIMFVSGGGVANDTAVNDGELYIVGGRADKTTITKEGCVYVHAGGLANNTTVYSECFRLFRLADVGIEKRISVCHNAPINFYQDFCPLTTIHLFRDSYISRLFGVRRKSSSPIVTIPFSSRRTLMFSRTRIIFLKESLNRRNGRFS